MSHRTTIDIRDLVISFNKRIRLCPDIDGRRALCSFIESILMDHKLYAGFGYVYDSGTFVSPEEIQAPGWSDDYRHSYYLHNRIQKFDWSIRATDATTM